MPKTFRLNSPDGQYTADIRPDLGALLTSLTYRHIELIDCPMDTPQWADGFPSAVLYPFPNRIKHGSYTWEEVTYQLYPNEKDRNHALHGLVWNQDFQLIQHTSDQLICGFTYTGQEPGYPFPFAIEMHFQLVNTGLIVEYQIQNTGSQPVPAAWGWHPYFKIGPTKIEDFTLTLPAHSVIPLGPDMIPKSAEAPIPVSGGTISLHNKNLDQVYQFSEHGENEIQLMNSVGRLTCLFSAENRYFTLYTPPSRKSIAIEPQTANIDTFNNKEGLWTLLPDEIRTGKVQIHFEEFTALGEQR